MGYDLGHEKKQCMQDTFNCANFLLRSFGAFRFFSSAWLCQQSSCNRNSSVVRHPSVRPSVRPSSVVRLWHRLSLKLLHGLLSNFSCGFPWDIIMSRLFCHFWKKFFFEFLGIFFVFVNMGPYGSQNFKTLLLPQITLESFQTVSESSSLWSSQKCCFGFLKFWVFDF